MAVAQIFSFFVNVHVMVASVVDACLWRFEFRLLWCGVRPSLCDAGVMNQHCTVAQRLSFCCTFRDPAGGPLNLQRGKTEKPRFRTNINQAQWRSS